MNDPENYSHGYVFQKSLEQNNWPAAHHKYLSRYNNNEKKSLSDFLKTIISPNGKWYDKSQMFTKERPGISFEYSNLGFAILGYILLFRKL